MASCTIKGANTSAHDFIIDVGMLTIDDSPDIECISFNTSSTEGGSPMSFVSAYRASVSLPRVDIRDRMFANNFQIFVMKKSASVSHRSLLSTGVNISGACVARSTPRITDHLRRGLESVAWNHSVYTGDEIS